MCDLLLHYLPMDKHEQDEFDQIVCTQFSDLMPADPDEVEYLKLLALDLAKRGGLDGVHRIYEYETHCGLVEFSHETCKDFEETKLNITPSDECDSDAFGIWFINGELEDFFVDAECINDTEQFLDDILADPSLTPAEKSLFKHVGAIVVAYGRGEKNPSPYVATEKGTLHIASLVKTTVDARATYIKEKLSYLHTPDEFRRLSVLLGHTVRLSDIGIVAPMIESVSVRYTDKVLSRCYAYESTGPLSSISVTRLGSENTTEPQLLELNGLTTFNVATLVNTLQDRLVGRDLDASQG